MEQHYKFRKWDFDENGTNVKDGIFFLDQIGEWERDFHNRYFPLFSNCLFGNASTMILVKNSLFIEPNEDCGMELINDDIDLETNIKIGKCSKRQTIYALESCLDKDEPLFLVRDETMVDGMVILKYIPDGDEDDVYQGVPLETWKN